ESAGHGTPEVMHHAEHSVTVALVVRNDAHGEQVVDLIEAALLANDFAMKRVRTLDARRYVGGDAGLDEFGADHSLHVFEKCQMSRRFVADFFLQREERLGLEIAERKIF